MNKKPLSEFAKAQAKAQGITEDEYRLQMSERAKKARAQNKSYFATLAETDPEKLVEISKKRHQK